MADGGSKKTILTQEDFARSKAILDRALRFVDGLARDAMQASIECCVTDRGDEQVAFLNARDDFAWLSAELLTAQAALTRARSMAGRIEVPGRVTRDGGT